MNIVTYNYMQFEEHIFIYIGYKEETFKDEGGEILEHVFQRSYALPITGSVQSQIGWVFKQPDLMKDVLAHGRALDELIFKSAFQPKPFYDNLYVYKLSIIIFI